jgi:hypothetical protein
MDRDNLTAREREILMAAEMSPKRKSTVLMAFYFAGIVFCAFYFGRSVTDLLAEGGQHTFKMFGSTAIIVCFMGLLYEHSKFQKQAFSLIRKLSENDV